MTPPATGSSVKDFPHAGGATALAEYIIGEVLPLIRAKYRTLPTAILAGHSAGGLFALDLAARRPKTFQGVIAMDPALWFNDSALVVTYSDAIVKSRTSLRIFVSTGSQEPDIEWTSKRFSERLDSLRSPSVAVAYRHYPEHIHSMTPLSFIDGLRFIFEPVSYAHLAIEKVDSVTADSVTLNNALLSSERTYAAAARSLGLPEELPERMVNRLGYRLLDRKKVSLAISVFKTNVAAYPRSVNVYDSFGDGLLAAGDTTAAIAQFRMALEVARQTGTEPQMETKTKLESLLAPKK